MPRQKILIDGFNLDLEAGTGVATYARNLSHAIHELGYDVHVLYGTRSTPQHPLLREIAFFDPRFVETNRFMKMVRQASYVMKAPLGVVPRDIPITGNIITRAFSSRLPYFDQLWNFSNVYQRANIYYHILGRRLRVRPSDPPAIAHWTYPLPIYVARTKNIYTIHDLVPLRLPYTSLEIKRRHFKLLEKLVKRADHIVTVSEASRKDIINLLGVPEERITNTYQAVDIPEKYAGKPEDVVRREVEGTFNLKYKEYMLFYGAIEPKKNVGRLIEGYLASKIDTPLVILGKLAWKSEQELRLFNDDVVRYLEQDGNLTFSRHRILRVDYAPFPLLVSLIRGAKAVLFPSLYEGFGLPVLESMQLGTPVLSSTESSIPEIAGDAAVLVDPYDTRAIADGIRALDANAELRGTLSAKGRARAALFSQENYRRRLDELYRRLM